MGIEEDYISIARELKREGKIEQALSKYSEALKINQNCVHALDDLGLIYETQNELSKAFTVAKRKAPCF
jgi:tetratricopeptide (TPR) repeat protein